MYNKRGEEMTTMTLDKETIKKMKDYALENHITLQATIKLMVNSFLNDNIKE